MTELGPIGALRIASSEADASAQPAPRRAELFALGATRGREPVVTLRVLAQGPDFVVECDVRADDARPNERRAAGPYVFATEWEAKAFVDEAATALQYLGCEIAAARA